MSTKLHTLEVIISVMEDELDLLHSKVKILEEKIEKLIISNTTGFKR